MRRRGTNEDAVQLVRIGLEIRHRFQNHMILVQLRVKRRDLALAEGVIKRFVNHLRRNSKPRSRYSVNYERRREARCLVVGRHIRKLRKFLQFFDEPLSPTVELRGVRILERVLKLSPTHAIFDR